MSAAQRAWWRDVRRGTVAAMAVGMVWMSVPVLAAPGPDALRPGDTFTPSARLDRSQVEAGAPCVIATPSTPTVLFAACDWL